MPAASGQFRQCQPMLASSRRARNAPIAASAWFAAASLPTPDTKPCGIPCQALCIGLNVRRKSSACGLTPFVESPAPSVTE